MTVNVLWSDALKSFKAADLGALHNSNGKAFGIHISVCRLNRFCKNGAVGILRHRHVQSSYLLVVRSSSLKLGHNAVL
jgi:hypothetical protein